MVKQEIEKPVTIKIDLPTNAYFMSGIRDFTLAMIRNMTDFSEQWAYRFQSVVDELCNNAIEHGSAANDEIHIEFTTYPDQAIEIVVEDNGTGKLKNKASDILKIMTEKQKMEINEIGIRGRGLAFIVDQWTDEFELTDKPEGGIRARVKKSLHDPKFKEELVDDKSNIILTV
jgi:anti-sigma regulatory factor (Ser/Thr protein kinase)